jgi:methylamine dehydrogenase accessory protein MauD
MILQWVIILALVIAVLALARQIGVLHTRLAPAGALMTNVGPKTGELVNEFSVEDLSGDHISIGGPREQSQLVLFVSPTCPICKSLIPAARSLARSERRRISLIFASDGGEREKHERYAADMALAPHPYVISLELGVKFAVGKLPYAVLIDESGKLRSKGLVNSREHLESLIESMDSGYESIQDYVESNALLQEEMS